MKTVFSIFFAEKKKHLKIFVRSLNTANMQTARTVILNFYTTTVKPISSLNYSLPELKTLDRTQITVQGFEPFGWISSRALWPVWWHENMGKWKFYHETAFRKFHSEKKRLAHGLACFDKRFARISISVWFFEQPYLLKMIWKPMTLFGMKLFWIISWKMYFRKYHW